jgi:hypothetical protein
MITSCAISVSLFPDSDDGGLLAASAELIIAISEHP